MIGAANLEAYTEKVANGHRRKGKSNNKPSCSNGSLSKFVNGGHFAIVFFRDNDRLVGLDSKLCKSADESIDHDLTAVSPPQIQPIHSFS